VAPLDHDTIRGVIEESTPLSETQATVRKAARVDTPHLHPQRRPG
jgi:hypothetical protein